MTILTSKASAPATASQPTTTPWSAMPGWGIVADLTPPELIAARGLRSLRKEIVAALVLVVLVCAGGYAWAASKENSADDRLAASELMTTQLTAQKAKYAGVVALQNATESINAQITGLMSTDVDIAAFVAKLSAAAPSGTVYTTANIALSNQSAAVATSPTGQPSIGTVTMSGTSTRMVDVAALVTALQSLPGVQNVVPSTNAVAKTGARASWTVTFELTTKLYSHRFDAARIAGTGTAGGGHK